MECRREGWGKSCGSGVGGCAGDDRDAGVIALITGEHFVGAPAAVSSDERLLGLDKDAVL